jgi:hypothetical protein
MDFSTGPRTAAKRALEFLDMKNKLSDYTL